MKKAIICAAMALALASCGQKPVTKAFWIEDKPGPSVQERRIFPTVPDEIWDSLGLKDGVPSSISCVLLQTEGKDILIDAGLGASFSQLLPKLAEFGITPEKLKYVFISHLHPDHIGGMLRDGQKTFPNAEVWINAIEADAWTAMEGDRAALPKAVLSAYADRLHRFQAGDILPGGVKTIEAYGHTPGHTVFQKDNILIIGDLIHGVALQVEHPEFCAFFDMDQEAAVEVRRRILRYAVDNKLTLCGMHLPAPGIIKTTYPD